MATCDQHVLMSLGNRWAVCPYSACWKSSHDWAYSREHPSPLSAVARKFIIFFVLGNNDTLFIAATGTMFEAAFGAFISASGPRLGTCSWSCPSVLRSSVSFTDAVVCGNCFRWRFPVQLFLWWNICHPAWMGSEHWRHIVVCDADRFIILPTTRYEQGRNCKFN